jgi:hypothetical protein
MPLENVDAFDLSTWEVGRISTFAGVTGFGAISHSDGGLV